MAPENTLESFQAALDAGVDMVELDLQLTSDNVWIACHDWATPGGEIVETTPWKDLAAGVDRNGLPPLTNILELLAGKVAINLEIKHRIAGRTRSARGLASEIEGVPGVLISSFDWGLLRELRAANAGLPLAPLVRHHCWGLVELCEEIGAVAVHCHRRMVGHAALNECPLPVLVYTVNDRQEISELRNRGLSGVFTDDPAKVREHLDQVTM